MTKAPAAPAVPTVPKPRQPKPRRSAADTGGSGTITFAVGERGSRTLAPGISMGVTTIDASARRVNGWLWVLPDARTIWLRDQPVEEPVVFYQDGEKRELTIAEVSRGAASGYLRILE